MVMTVKVMPFIRRKQSSQKQNVRPGPVPGLIYLKGGDRLLKYEYDKEYPFAVYLTNLGKYNKGELIGEWVKFPTTPKEIVGVMRRIMIGETDDFGCPYEEFFIADYDCYIPGLYEMAGEYESLDELNMLASELEKMSEGDFRKFSAVIEAGEAGSSVRDLINLAESLDYYSVYPEIKTDADLGRYYLEESGAYDLSAMGRLADYIDAERFGRDLSIEEGGTFTDYGYVRKESDVTPVQYDGKNVPKEYRVLIPSENYLKNAEEALEDDYNQIDGIINNGEKEPKAREEWSMKDTLGKLCEECERKVAKREQQTTRHAKQEPSL